MVFQKTASCAQPFQLNLAPKSIFTFQYDAYAHREEETVIKKIWLGWVGVALATLLLMAGCGGGTSGDPEQGTGSQQQSTGTSKVVSAATGLALSGAAVRAGATTVTTTADGSYAFTAEVDERVVIAVEKTGYAETGRRLNAVFPGVQYE